MKIDATQTISETGEMKLEMLYDLTGMAEFQESMESAFGDSSSSSPSRRQASSTSSVTFDCDEFLTEEGPVPAGVKNVKCEEKGPFKFLISATLKLPRSQFIKRKSGTKTVYLYNLQQASKMIDTESMTIDEQPIDQAGQELAESILQGTVTIVMPGKITRAPGGVITGNSVKFNIMELPKVQGRKFIQAVK